MTDAAADNAEPAAPLGPATGGASVSILPPESLPAGYGGRIVEEAVLQLRRLGELREQESKRHELMIAEIRDHVQRQRRTSAMLLLLILLLIGAVVALGLITRRSGRDQAQTREAIGAAVAKVGDLAGEVKAAAAQQSTRLDAVTTALTANGHKLDAVQVDVNARVDASLRTVREDRDAVNAAIRTALDDQTHRLAQQEITLRDQEKRLQEELDRVKQERQRIVQEAIDRLSALTKPDPLAPAPAPAKP